MTTPVRRGRTLARVAAVVLATGGLLGPGQAQATGTPAIVAGPGSTYGTYTQPVAVIEPGDEVTLHVLDIGRHDVIAEDAYRPDDSADYCSDFEAGQCPLFWTPLRGLGGSTPVLGLHDIQPGTYPFYCSAHGAMFGQLIVL